MKKERHWLERMTDAADLPGEASLQPVVELAGDRRVLIEHHRGVTQYQRDKICVNVKYGTVAVCGAELELARMSKELLVISGRIDGITLHRRNG